MAQTRLRKHQLYTHMSHKLNYKDRSYKFKYITYLDKQSDNVYIKTHSNKKFKSSYILHRITRLSKTHLRIRSPWPLEMLTFVRWKSSCQCSSGQASQMHDSFSKTFSQRKPRIVSDIVPHVSPLCTVSKYYNDFKKP